MRNHDRRAQWPPRRTTQERAHRSAGATPAVHRALIAANPTGTAQAPAFLTTGTLTPVELRRIVAGVMG